MRQVDDLHDPEHQRQPAREQRVQAAGEHPLDDGVYPGHNCVTPSAGRLAGFHAVTRDRGAGTGGGNGLATVSPAGVSANCAGVSATRGRSPQAEVGRLDPLGSQVARFAFQRGPPFEQALHPGGDPQGLADILLDEQHRQAGRQDLRQHAVDALDDHRRQAERQLVEQQDPGVGHERPADGHRLLLAAG